MTEQSSNPFFWLLFLPPEMEERFKINILWLTKKEYPLRVCMTVNRKVKLGTEMKTEEFSHTLCQIIQHYEKT